jgi:hypothetical protein
MIIEFLTEYPGGYRSAWAIYPSGHVFNFLYSPEDSRVSAIRRRLPNGKWHTLHAKQAVRWAAEIEQAVARKMADGVDTRMPTNV